MSDQERKFLEQQARIMQIWRREAYIGTQLTEHKTLVCRRQRDAEYYHKISCWYIFHLGIGPNPFTDTKND